MTAPGKENRVGLRKISDKLQNCRAPWAYTALSIDERNYFDRELKIGDVSNYCFIEKPANEDGKGREWKGRFIGYPLVEIKDREVAKKKILNKLFAHN